MHSSDMGYEEHETDDEREIRYSPLHGKESAWNARSAWVLS